MTAPSTKHSAYPKPIDDLMPAARRLTAKLGALPSRNQLKTTLKIGAPKASSVLAGLVAEATEATEAAAPEAVSTSDTAEQSPTGESVPARLHLVASTSEDRPTPPGTGPVIPGRDAAQVAAITGQASGAPKVSGRAEIAPGGSAKVGRASRAARRAEAATIREAARIERERMRREADAVREAERVHDIQRRQAVRDARRTARSGLWRAGAQVAHRMAAVAVPFVPLVAVNTLAVVGQFGYAAAELTNIADGAPRVVVAATFAVALESIALFLGWHAAAALRRRDSAAGKQMAAYLVAALVASLNYLHFADGLSPNPTAIAFGIASLVSPWLWGVHSRARHRDELHTAGEVDVRAVKLSAARKLWHPVKSLQVIRHASWHGVTDPAQAVDAWETERARKTVIRDARRAERHAAEQARKEHQAVIRDARRAERHAATQPRQQHRAEPKPLVKQAPTATPITPFRDTDRSA